MAVESFANVVADHFVGRTVDLTRVDASQRRAITRQLMLLRDEIVSKIDNIAPTAVSAETFQQQRLKKLLETVDSSIKVKYRELSRDHLQFLREISDLEHTHVGKKFSTLLEVDIMSATLAPQVLKELASDSLISGRTQKEWWDLQSQNLRRKFLGEMRQGVALGETNQQLARRVRGEHTGRFTTVELKSGKKRRLGVFRGGIMDSTQREASTLVRTSVQTVANNVRHETLKKNRDVVKGEQVQATLDAKTSEICISLSGEAWDFEGKPIPPTKSAYMGPPPYHFNCRSIMIPVLRSWDELMDGRRGRKLSARKRRELRKLDKGAQASMDGQVAGNLRYEDWLKGKDVAFQKDVLGPGKWQLWKDGKISSLRELTDQTGNPLTLAQLRERT